MTEHIVIGAGLAGAATARALAERGESVTVLEQDTPASGRGSSHGSARILRFAYRQRLYVDLVVASRALWADIERASGTELITATGAVDHGEVRHVSELAAVFDTVGIEHEVLSAAEATARWPQMRFDTEVLWHPAAGVLDAETAVVTMLDLAVATDRVRVLEDWTVAEVGRRSGGGFRVTSASGGAVDGDTVIVAAGGFLPVLLPHLGLPEGFRAALPKFEVRQEQAFHFPYRTGDAPGQPAVAWPTFIHKSGEIFTYGLPGGRDAGFSGLKVAEFNGGRVIPSARDQDGRTNSAMRERMTAYAKRHLPGLVPEPYAETTCLFTSTPSEDFLIDSVDGVVIVSACSGHGAKFAPMIGELAADLATGQGGVPEEFRVANHAG